jgi:hypothetical protein
LEKLAINLSLKGDNGNTLSDGVVVKYHNSFSTAVGDEDAQKILNIDENLGITRANRTLSVEGRPLIDETDTLFLSLGNIKPNRSYEFEFTPTGFDAPLLSAFLQDRYLQTSTPISLSSTSLITFNVTDASSAPVDRFRIVFTTNSTLPIAFSGIKASQKGSDVQVDWSLANEKGITAYEVEKSTNGVAFSKASVVTSRNSSGAVTYNWLDANATAGDNFYRIKAIEANGSTKYTSIVKVKIGGAKSSLSVYPNPVVGKTLTVQFVNRQKGTYDVELINSAGQRLLVQKIVHAGGSAAQTVQLPATASKGTYQLKVTGDAFKHNQSVILD